MQTLLTGDRPTGKLHLGHYVGSIKNRILFQNQYNCHFIIADLHALTTKNSQEEIFQIYQNAKDLVADTISCGINYEKSNFYLQSAIPEMYEIYTLLQSLVTVPRLERIPSLKDMLKSSHFDEMPFALLGYPVLQSADILCVRAHKVPVGKDNIAHIEITREIARKFNALYGEVFPIPEAYVSDIGSLVGIDGNAKMSKSLNNSILLSEDENQLKKKIMKMFTDPNRTSADVPGKVEGNPVFIYHDIFNENKTQVADLKQRYTKGTVGDVEVKEKLFTALNEFLKPIRERREKIIQDKGLLDEIIYNGTQSTQIEVQKTLYAMKKAMGLTSNWNRIRRKVEERNKTKS